MARVNVLAPGARGLVVSTRAPVATEQLSVLPRKAPPLAVGIFFGLANETEPILVRI